MRPVLLVALLLGLLAGGAQAATIGLRAGEHPGFGRLVFDLPAGARTELHQTGETVLVRLPVGDVAAAPPRLPRNIVALHAIGAEVLIAVRPGTRLRRQHLGNRLVLDFLDAAAATPPPARAPLPLPPVPPPAVTAPPAAEAVAPPPQPLEAPPPAVGEAAAPPGSVRPAPVAARERPRPAAPPPTPLPPIPSPPGPIHLAAAPAGTAEPPAAALMPFDGTVGAAAFARHGQAVIVFDRRRPIDLSALRAVPAFAHAAVRLVAGGTVLTLPLPAGQLVVLARATGGWSVALEDEATAPVPAPLKLGFVDGELRFATATPGRTVAMQDPDSGAALLVGTLRQPGAAILLARSAPEFRLPATWLGVVVEAASDRLDLRPTNQGFTLSAGAGAGLRLSGLGQEAAAANGKPLSRRFDFPDLATRALLRRLQAAEASAAAAPVQARTLRRGEVAQAMLALGLGAEAQSELGFTRRADSRGGDDPDLIGLQAIAALLAGRPGQAQGLGDPRLDGSDEITLWRALRTAGQPDGGKAAAPALAATLPLLLDYPAPLRRRLLPTAMEALVAGGELAAARRIADAAPGDHQLDIGRARLALADAKSGDPAAALKILDAAANGNDRLVRARAIRAAVELRLASHALTPEAAADTLDRALYAWRGDGREYDNRLRIARLRGEAGQWPQALAMLRETAGQWPNRAEALRPRMVAAFTRAIAAKGTAAMAPFDLVTLAAENADLIPDGPEGEALAARVADRLGKLDLPRRAAEVLARLVAGAPPGPARAEFGGRLAAMREEAGDHAGALDALNATAVPGLPDALLEQRTMVFARAAVALGDTGSAVAALAALRGLEPLRLRARLLEEAKDWPAAESALAALATRTLPPAGMLDTDQARLVVRLASAAEHVGDNAALARLRADLLARMPPGGLSQMVELLTSAPVGGVADLARAGEDAKFAKALPAGWTALTQ